jgi:hypothetical protein
MDQENFELFQNFVLSKANLATEVKHINKRLKVYFR